MFVEEVEDTIKRFVEHCVSRFEIKASWQVIKARPEDGAGVWVSDKTGMKRKIAAIGLGFSREAIRHGFALNIAPLGREFSWINPCGDSQGLSASLFESSVNEATFENVVKELEHFLKRK